MSRGILESEPGAKKAWISGLAHGAGRSNQFAWSSWMRSPGPDGPLVAIRSRYARRRVRQQVPPVGFPWTTTKHPPHPGGACGAEAGLATVADAETVRPAS